ncbi:MAG: ABC transporter permease [Chitinivibrionales bacterium]|nr:ABC transporter permease [Chitinivibrionales bacterium]
MKRLLNDLADTFGASVRVSIEMIGSLSIFFARTVFSRWRYRAIVDQMYHIGVMSLPMVMLVSICVGGISAITYVSITDALHPAPSLMGKMVSTTVFIDLGPALIGLILAGRIAAKITAEIGNMKVTEQIDALTVLSLDPYSYLILPRIAAGFFMAPVFFVAGSLVSIISSQIFSTLTMGLSPYIFYNGMKYGFTLQSMMTGVVKVIIFTVINTLVGCYYGHSTTGGAIGVGLFTRDAVVASCVLIIVANLIVSALLL